MQTKNRNRIVNVLKYTIIMFTKLNKMEKLISDLE